MSLPRIGERLGDGQSAGNGFTRLEYLQSTGTQYIVTDFFMPSEGLYLWADVQFVGTNDFTTGNEVFFDWDNRESPYNGANFGAASGQIYELYNWWGRYDAGAGHDYYCINSSSEVINSRNIYEVNDLTVSYGPHRLYIVGNGRGVELEIPFIIFGGYKNGTTEVSPFGRWNMRIFEMKLGLRDGTITHHFVPALDSNGRPCLLDLISGQAFYNGGTGEFLFQIRADLPNGYTKIEYLESTGTQWIDTGIIPDEFTGAYVVAEGQPEGDVYPMGAIDIASTAMGSQFYRWWPAAGTRRFANCYGWKSYVLIYLNGGTGIFNSSLNWFSSSTATYQLLNQKVYTSEVLKPWDEQNETHNYTISLYALSGSPVTIGAFKIYSAAISHKDKIICNFVPALDPDNRPCMFDTISRTPFYSESSEGFQWG